MESVSQFKSLKYNTKAYTIKDIYMEYAAKHIDNEKQFVSYKIFREILNEYFKYIEEEIVDNSRSYKLPYGLGSLYVAKSKTKRKYVDFSKKDEENTKFTITMNEHSDGWRYRFRWAKDGANIYNLKKYSLSMVRRIKRKLATVIKAKQTDYLEG